ncbi:MAG: DUF2778 domain-containing protein [Phreatobacter sp.]|uniref:DUF2778 domain-containing protein n=1 Tax=Phreatobacter sp. TaxID=1966341 RepID=UPI002736045D|nr:DUF2778 domain-containing protein [Phreatobacter sp.]MDP2800557.1 DUF2778 domain-containing protein [Phreatobacter sp.]
MRDLTRDPSGRQADRVKQGGQRFPWLTVLALSAGVAGLATLSLRDDKGDVAKAAIATIETAGLADPRPAFAALGSFAPLLDPSLSLGGKPATLAQNPPLSGHWQPAAPAAIARATVPEPGLPNVVVLASLPGRDTGLPAVSSLIQPAPLPPARPDPQGAISLDGPDTTMVAPLPPRRPALAPANGAPETPRTAARRGERETAVAPAAQPDGRNFFERIFGPRREADGPQLAYAPSSGGAVDSGTGGGSFGSNLGLSFPGLSAPKPPMGLAIYDIGSRMVYLPNGERLEAQSGLGEMRNDVRYAHVRMRGPTPPHTYDLVEREALFHGVRAIRLQPVGGSQAIHGRAGLLAHTYLLGPSGDSNGCISIKDYDRFLQAYLRGEIRRLIVVRTRSEAVQAVARANVQVSQR